MSLPSVGTYKGFGVLHAHACSVVCCIQLFPTPWTVCSPLCSSVHGILQARILEWVARGSSQPRDGTQADSLSLNHQESLLCLTWYLKPNLFWRIWMSGHHTIPRGCCMCSVRVTIGQESTTRDLSAPPGYHKCSSLPLLWKSRCASICSCHQLLLPIQFLLFSSVGPCKKDSKIPWQSGWHTVQ